MTSQPAAASADGLDCSGVVVPADLAVISSPFLFISNLCFRSKPFTNPRAALATAPGRLDASTVTFDSTVSSLRSRKRNCTSNVFMLLPPFSDFSDPLTMKIETGSCTPYYQRVLELPGPLTPAAFSTGSL